MKTVVQNGHSAFGENLDHDIEMRNNPSNVIQDHL